MERSAYIYNKKYSFELYLGILAQLTKKYSANIKLILFSTTSNASTTTNNKKKRPKHAFLDRIYTF
jgi:hypothetical protein